MFDFSYSLDDTDYLEFNKFHYKTAPASKRIMYATQAFVPVALFIISILFFLNNRDIPAFLMSVVIYTIISVAWVFSVKPLATIQTKITIKNIKKDGRLPYSKTVQIQFDEENITVNSEEAKSEYKYSIIEKIAEGDSAVYIYIGAIQAFIIPFSVFQTADRKNNFLEFIKMKMGC